MFRIEKSIDGPWVHEPKSVPPFANTALPEIFIFWIKLRFIRSLFGLALDWFLVGKEYLTIP